MTENSIVRTLALCHFGEGNENFFARLLNNRVITLSDRSQYPSCCSILPVRKRDESSSMTRGFLIGVCGIVAAASLVGCGGSTSESIEPIVIVPDSMMKASVDGRSGTSAFNPLVLPIPVGATRVLRIESYDIGGELDSRFNAQRAEDLFAELDSKQVPFNIVHCAGYNTGFASAGGLSLLVVLDLEDKNLLAAEKIGFAKLTVENTPALYSDDLSCTYNRPSFTPEQRIQGYARRVYPHLFTSFSPGLYEYGIYQQYRYRYYPKSENYLGLAGDDVYVHNGRDWDFLYVGKVKDFIPYIDGIPGTQPLPTAAAKQ